MSRRWIAALLALAVCASVLAAEDMESFDDIYLIETDDEVEGLSEDDFAISGPFNVAITFDEDFGGFSEDDLHIEIGDDGVYSLTLKPVEQVASFQIVSPLLVGVEDGRNPTQALEIFEDMNVFGAILSDLVQKAFPQEHFFADKLRIRPLYLGRGCLYMMDFPYPLADSRPSRADAEMDAVWDAARQKLGLGADETYDAEKASQFQNAVLSAFKHASNMRHFADADFIAVSAMSGSGIAPTYFSARAEFGSLASPSTSSERMDASTAQGGAVVMARVLDKMLQEKLGDKYSLGRSGRLFTGNPSAGSSWVHLGKGAGGVYLEGYGALFVADALFPLAPRSEEDLWEQSARELRAGRRANRLRTSDVSGWRGLGDGKTYTATITPSLSDSSAPPVITTIDSPYGNEGQLKERLMEAVLDALQYASRIQGMDAEEHVDVLIRGMENTQMSFRALKRDVDAYGKGELTRGEFRAKLQLK